MTTSIGECDSDVWDYENISQIDRAALAPVECEFDEVAILKGMQLSEIREMFASLVREDRYTELLSLFDKYTTLARQELETLQTQESPSEAVQDAIEFSKEIIEYVAPLAKSVLLLLCDQPQEAIALSNSLIDKIDSTSEEEFELLTDVHICRGLSYLMTGEKELGIHDLRNLNDVDAVERDVELFVAMRSIGDKIGAKILDQIQFSAEDVQRLSVEEQIELHLLNGAPELALALLELENLNKFLDSDFLHLEYTVIAQALAGQVDKAAVSMDTLLAHLELLSATDPTPEDELETSIEFLYFVQGNYSKAKEEAKKSMNLPLLTIVHCLETLQRRLEAPKELALFLNKA